MKCIRCGTDSNLKERTANQGRCSNCTHAFAFEPTAMGDVKFTDAFFAKVIDDLSASHTLHFTPKQLLYFLDRRLKKKGRGGIFGFIFLYVFFSIWAPGFIGGLMSVAIGPIAYPLVLIGLNFFFFVYLFRSSNSSQVSPQNRRDSATCLQVWGFLVLAVGVGYSWFADQIIAYGIAALVGLSLIWLGYFQKRRISTMPEAFSISAGQLLGWLDSWSRINGSVRKLLPSPAQTLPATSPNSSPDPEITAYSFDRLVVCQSDEIAQMLIANNFHFENNCAILGISSYPQSIFETAMQMLRRNPNLRVFAFHDCSPKGIKLVHTIRTDPNWFPDEGIAIVDVGLSPRQILAVKWDVFIQQSPASAQAAQLLDPHIRQNLAELELQWLDKGNFVELESLTPQRLIQVLNRTIANSQQLNTIEGDTLILVGGDMGYFYATESFG